MAQSFRASVEGAFVRVRKEHFFLSDRKVHFRYTTDYSMIQGPLMKKLGIMSIRMTTMQSNNPPYGSGGTLLILAVKECKRMRDMLAEIDSLRENGYAEPPRPAEPSSAGAPEGRPR